MKRPPLTLLNPLESQAKSVPRRAEAAPIPREPPGNLREPGRDLWNRVVGEFEIADTAGLTLLALACQALDRAEGLRQRIDADGETIQTPHGVKSHPGIRDELSNRAFVAKALERLGIAFEMKRPVGRPPKNTHWTGED
jgi:phage terminase small subunit